MCEYECVHHGLLGYVVNHCRGCPALAVPGRNDTAAKVVQPGEDGLDEHVSRGRVRAAAVFGDEEGERVRGHVGQGANLRQDDLYSDLKVRLAIRGGVVSH